MASVFNTSSGYSEPVRDPKTGRVTMKPKIDDIDMQKTADLIVEAKMIQADPYRDEVKTKTEEILPEMQAIIDKASTLKKTLLPLTNKLNPVDSYTSVFNKKVAIGNLDNGESTAPFVQFVIDTPAVVENRRYDFKVDKIATYDQILGTQTFASKNSALSLSQTINIATLDDDYTTPRDTSISITSDMTLQNVVDEINQSPLNDVVQANVMKISDGDYRLNIRSKITGSPITLGTDPDYEDAFLTSFGLRAGNDVSQPSVSDLSAQVEYDGVTITRPTNTFNDLIAGVTVNLLADTNTNTAHFTVESDGNKAYAAIQDFVTAYSDLNDTLIKNNKIKADGTPDDEAVLYGERIIFEAKNLLLANFGRALEGSESDDFSSFTEIGINFTPIDPQNLNPDQLNGSISIVDDELLRNSIGNNFEKVAKLFGQYATSSNHNFRVVTIPSEVSSTLAGTALTVTVSEVDTDLYSAHIDDGNGHTENVMLSGGVITTASDGYFKGMQIFYTGPNPSGATTYESTIKVTRGLADHFHENLSQALKPKVVNGDIITSIGTFNNEIEKVLSKKKTLNKYIEDIETEAKIVKEKINKKMFELYEVRNETLSILNTLNAYYAANDK